MFCTVTWEDVQMHRPWNQSGVRKPVGGFNLGKVAGWSSALTLWPLIGNVLGTVSRCKGLLVNESKHLHVACEWTQGPGRRSCRLWIQWNHLPAGDTAPHVIRHHAIPSSGSGSEPRLSRSTLGRLQFSKWNHFWRHTGSFSPRPIRGTSDAAPGLRRDLTRGMSHL